MQLLSVYVNERGSFDQPTVVLWCFLRQDSRIHGRIVDARYVTDEVVR